MKNLGKSLGQLAATVSVLALLPIAQAAAQQTGTYSGRTADGNPISFGGGQATGTTEARLPVLVPGKSPSAVQLCTSAKQAFEASFQSADTAHLFDHPGNARLKAPERTAILEWSSQGITYQELRKQ